MKEYKVYMSPSAWEQLNKVFEDEFKRQQPPLKTGVSLENLILFNQTLLEGVNVSKGKKPAYINKPKRRK